MESVSGDSYNYTITTLHWYQLISPANSHRGIWLNVSISSQVEPGDI